MKKIVSILAVALLALSMVACGGKTETVTMRSTQDQNGVTMEDTMTFEAKGDKITKITEVLKMDCSSFDDATYELLKQSFDELSSGYEGVAGVEFTPKEDGKVITWNIVIDPKPETIEMLAKAGLLQTTGDADKGLSLKVTKEGLSKNGYEEVK